MRHKRYETKYGSIDYRQYGYPDLYPNKAMASITKAQLFKLIVPNSVKGNLKKARERVSRQLYRLMWKIIVDSVMEGNIVELPYGGTIYIGSVINRSKKHVNFNTNGVVYNIKLSLQKQHSYKLRMPYRRRKELNDRLNRGQHYVNF